MSYRDFDLNFGLNGKVAIITGAASGIGKATAQIFAKKGANVVLVDIKSEVKDVAQSIDNNQALGIIADLTNKDSIFSVIEQALNRFHKIDILFNSAGVAILDAAENLSEEAWDKTMQLNLKAVFLLSQQVGNVMIKQKFGTIINMASQAGKVALDKHLAYCASKAAVISMTKVLAVEWARHGIRVNSISPTVILTELGEKAWAGEVGENMKKLIPAGRFGYPEEVAACAVFLSSDAANLITGEDLIIDGGYTVK